MKKAHQAIKGSILVVEDEKVVAKDIAATLKKFGYIVTATVSSGEEALRKLEEGLSVDLVLMDIVLRGDVDGIEAAREIHEKYRLPVVHLTGYADDDTLERVKDVAPMGYLLKPYKERELYTTIEIAILRHHRTLQREQVQKEKEEQLRVELDKLTQFSDVKNSIFKKFLQDLSDPVMNVKVAMALLMDNFQGPKRDYYLQIIKQEFDRELELINQTSNLEDLLNVENVILLSQFSLLRNSLNPSPQVGDPKPRVERPRLSRYEPPSAPEPTVPAAPIAGGFQGFSSHPVVSRRPGVTLPPRDSVPPSFGFTPVDQEPEPMIHLSTRSMHMRPLNQTQLAERLGVVVSAITYWKMKTGFADWSRSKDPEGYAWRYSSDSKRFSPEVVI